MSLTLHYLLMANHALVQKQLFNAIKDSGLTLGQPKVLDYLKDNNGAMQKDIAKGCHIEPASLSAILNGMEKSGLITRNIGSSRRSINIFLTEKGRNSSEQIETEFNEIEKKALAGFTHEEIEQINEYLEKIHNNLEGNHA